MPTRRRRQAENTAPQVDVTYMDLTDITKYENNPRDNTAAVDSVAESIRTFGFLVPIVVDADMVIVAGHTRYDAAIQLGLTDVPCVVASHLTQAQIDAFRLIDNKVSELAEWNMDLLAGEITALHESGINLQNYGWTAEEIDCLTDVVAEDCLALGENVGLAGRDSQASTGSTQRAPNRTRLVVGEFVIFIPQDTYRRWAATLRAEYDYVESAIEAEIKRRLGITPFEQ